ncbi:hypothetical protein ACLOJK_038242 [Asimina triloba]
MATGKSDSGGCPIRKLGPPKSTTTMSPYRSDKSHFRLTLPSPSRQSQQKSSLAPATHHWKVLKRMIQSVQINGADELSEDLPRPHATKVGSCMHRAATSSPSLAECVAPASICVHSNSQQQHRRPVILATNPNGIDPSTGDNIGATNIFFDYIISAVNPNSGHKSTQTNERDHGGPLGCSILIEQLHGLHSTHHYPQLPTNTIDVGGYHTASTMYLYSYKSQRLRGGRTQHTTLDHQVSYVGSREKGIRPFGHERGGVGRGSSPFGQGGQRVRRAHVGLSGPGTSQTGQVGRMLSK